MSEPKKSINIILGLPLEIRLYLEAKCRDNITNTEILALLNEKFPYVEGVTPQSIASFRKKVCPNYKELLLERYGKKAQKPESEIEEEILEAVRESEEAGEEFSKNETQKINMLKAHKRILKELYEQYKSVKNSTDEVAKKNYLESMLKCLSSIREQEAAERDILSAFADVRKAEAKLTPEQAFDSLKGWFILRASEKCKSKEETEKYIIDLKVYLDNYLIILQKSSSIEESVKEMLAKLYVSKQIKKEEEPVLDPKLAEEKGVGPLHE